MAKAIVIIVAVLAIGGGSYAVLHKNSDKTSTKTSNTSSNSGSSSKPASSSSTASDSSSPLNVTVTTNDTSASPDTINVSKGQTVNLTFKVGSDGTYHGGLDFKSTDPAIDSGSIAGGKSKTISFIATKTFKFTPYWYQSDVQKDYFVTVNVQ